MTDLRSLTTWNAVPPALFFCLALGFGCALASSVQPAHAEEAPAGCEAPLKRPHFSVVQRGNIGQLKLRAVYYRCTRYDADVARVLHHAERWVEHAARRMKKPALVLDIDETSLSNWKQLYKNDFGYIADGSCDFATKTACGQSDWEKSASGEPIKPTRALFGRAKALGVTIFFITGRHEAADERAATEDNLHKAGYDGWAHLYMRTAEFKNNPSVSTFKTWARREIEKQGYTIIANVGDQQSDLANGHALRRFKVPNPFYYIP
jgi:hypothetical protein